MMTLPPVTAPSYTAEQVDAAVALLSDPERMAHASEVVTHAAPSLQHILAEALSEDRYFEETHERHVAQVAGVDDPQERLRQVRTLVAEEVRMGMMVGVAVGFQLAHELLEIASADASSPDAGEE
jgi:hypothetical protein